MVELKSCEKSYFQLYIFFSHLEKTAMGDVRSSTENTERALAECNTAAVQHDAEMGLWEHKGFPYSQGAQLLAALALISSKAAASS